MMCEETIKPLQNYRIYDKLCNLKKKLIIYAYNILLIFTLNIMAWRVKHKEPKKMCMRSDSGLFAGRIFNDHQLETANIRKIMLYIGNTAVFEIVLFTPKITPVDRI